MSAVVRASLISSLAIVASAGCFDGPSYDAGAGTTSAPGALTVNMVDWNPAKVDVGVVQVIAERDHSLVVFGSKGVQTIESGAIVSSDDTLTEWRAAAFASSPDGLSTWLVGVDAHGHVQRLPVNGAPADVSDRYGLAADDVQSVASGASRVAFQVASGLAVTDGARVTRYAVPARAIGIDGTKVALAGGDTVRLIDGDAQHQVTLAGVEHVAFDGAGHLLAATAHVLYLLNTQGASDWVTPLYDAGARTIHQLVGGGGTAWFSVDGDLGRVRDGHVALATGTALAPDAKLVSSASGDAWTISSGALVRWTEGAAQGDEGVWQRTVQPVHAAVCSKCHGPSGSGQDSSRIDLSTYDAWVARKPRIRERVVTQAGTPAQMPPTSSAPQLTDEQRAAIEAWSKP